MPLQRLFFVAAMLFFSTAGFAQKSEADSLESLVMSVPSDTTKVWLLNELVDALREKDNNKAYEYATEAAEMAELLNYQRGLARALQNVGWILYRRGDFSKSLETCTRALRLSESLHENSAVAKCLINMAAIHYEQKQYAEAIRYFKDAQQVAKKAGDRVIVSRCFNNIAYTFLAIKEIDSAAYYCRIAYAIASEAKETYMQGFALRTMGDIELERKHTKEAMRNFFECYEISIKLNNMFLKSSVLHRLAKTYYTLGKDDEALSYLAEDVDIAKQYGFRDELERTYKLMAEIYHDTRDLEKAYQYQNLFLALHDSLHDQRNSEQIAMMQIRFDTELKQAQIELLTKSGELKNEELTRKQVLIYFTVGCALLLLLLAFVLYYNNRHNRNARISLQQKNREIQNQTRQLRNLNSTKDKLFSIISHDLRSPVASLKALMELVSTSGLTQEEFNDITKVLKRNLDTVYDDLDNLLLWAQTQLRGLQAVPEKIDLRSIADDKILLFRELAENKKLTLMNSIPEGMMVEADRNHVGLVFRNLIANAVKFNRTGGHVMLDATSQDDSCLITVSDSGVGINEENLDKLFNPETHFTTPGTNQEKGMGIGLLLTKEFVEKNNGSIAVQSAPGKGTTFTITLKLVQAEVVAI